LLDTNVVIHVLKKNKAVARRFAERAGDMAIPAMVQGELLYGVARSQNPSRNAELLKSLIDALPVLHTNDAIMQTFAAQKAALSARGELVDDADLLIAATALSYGATLATCNIRHFVRFDELRVEDWGV
jgi:tRNA(fMet)-specific endonuclease VapC